MKETKYIVINTGLMDAIIMFPSSFDHADFARMVVSKKEDIVSAGFIRLSISGYWHCYGRSAGLDMKARPVDSEIANRQFPTMDD